MTTTAVTSVTDEIQDHKLYDYRLSTRNTSMLSLSGFSVIHFFDAMCPKVLNNLSDEEQIYRT